jgi:hypothetical protein
VNIRAGEEMELINFQNLYSKVDKLQEEIGVPVWQEDKKTFEYKTVDVKVVSILKAIRAVQGLKSLELLCQNGLFIDMGAIIRCVMDCICEIYFLLEKYPEQTNNVKEFIEAFSETTIDGFLSSNAHPTPTKKIHAATVRAITQSEQDQKTADRIGRIYKAFSGYTHANYSHIMQIYGGDNWRNLSFNLGGVPSDEQKHDHYKLILEISKLLFNALDFMDKSFRHPAA